MLSFEHEEKARQVIWMYEQGGLAATRFREYEKHSKASKEGWATRREKRRKFIAMCHWRTMRGWETRRAKQPKRKVQKIRGSGRRKSTAAK